MKPHNFQLFPRTLRTSHMTTVNARWESLSWCLGPAWVAQLNRVRQAPSSLPEFLYENQRISVHGIPNLSSPLKTGKNEPVWFMGIVDIVTGRISSSVNLLVLCKDLRLLRLSGTFCIVLLGSLRMALWISSACSIIIRALGVQG